MDDLDTAASALGALAHPDRLRAFRLLVTDGPGGRASGRIAAALEMPATRASFHLSALERAGLVCARREGREVRYAARFDAMHDLLSFLTEDCCGGRPEICRGLAVAGKGTGV